MDWIELMMVIIMFVQIIFVPRVSGVFVAQLHLHSSPVAADELAAKSSKLPIMVTLQAIAEKPSIQVFLPIIAVLNSQMSALLGLLF